MRLALITHRFVKGDGQGRVNYELARAALADGHLVWLIASEVAPDFLAHPGARVVLMPVAAWPTALLQNQIFALKATRWLARHRHEIDIVHANGFVTWSSTDVSSAHFVHAAWLRSRFHTWHVRRDAYGLYQLLYTACGKWLEAWAYRHAQVVVAVSQQVRRELLASGLQSGRVRVIANGVDTEEFKPGSVSRAALGLPPGKLLLFAGDIKTPRKNLDTLLRALVHVNNVSLAVAGDTAGSRYPALAAELDLQARTYFLGFRRDLATLMQAADIFVFPSRYEACSLVLLEAAAAGLPIIAAHTTGGTELLTSECSALVTDADDAIELATVLRRLLANPRQLEQMGQQARRIALANSWQAMALRYLQLYQELLDRRSHPHAWPAAAAAAVPPHGPS